MEIAVPVNTRAEENILAVQALVKTVMYNFLELGGLLAENQDNKYWQQCRYESFPGFVQQLGVSYDWATRLIGLARVVAQQVLTKDEVLEIGVAKACLLLPHIKKGGLDENTRLLARDCTWSDLRKALGHNIPNPEDCEEYVQCPACGREINPIRVPCHCGEQVMLNAWMIKRR